MLLSASYTPPNSCTQIVFSCQHTGELSLQFGVPLYGASLQGQLKFVSSNEQGCDPFHDEFQSDDSGNNFVALVIRGGWARSPWILLPLSFPSSLRYLVIPTGCYFVEKAYNAEQAGAKAIMVMDDREEQLLTMAAPEDHPEIAKLREDISIPTALITKVRSRCVALWVL